MQPTGKAVKTLMRLKEKHVRAIEAVEADSVFWEINMYDGGYWQTDVEKYDIKQITLTRLMMNGLIQATELVDASPEECQFKVCVTEVGQAAKSSWLAKHPANEVTE